MNEDIKKKRYDVLRYECHYHIIENVVQPVVWTCMNNKINESKESMSKIFKVL